MIWSSRRRNRIPSQNPATAGTNASFPISTTCSIAGIKRLQIDAATITPAANPVSIRCSRSPISFFIKNTHAAPNDVPRNGINIP